jgi:putative endonuclease
MTSTHTPEAAGAGDPRRALGSRGEALALAHLVRLGFELVARNHRTRWGEIDLIVFDGRTLVFVEVKTRRASGRAGSALEAVAPPKQHQVRRIAAAWLAEVSERPRSAELRFDAIGVTVDAGGELLRLDHVEGAF